ncbi:MAG: hypothetical protein QM759_09425 [Terricaulis sp.]
MARSLLDALVRGTRQMLTVQLIASVAAIALAGWTLAITNEVIRERDQLRARVIQLEAAMGSQGLVVPPKPATLDRPVLTTDNNGYPPAVGGLAALHAKDVQVITGAEPASTPAPASGFNPTRVLQDIFTPPPPIRALVLHAHGADDAAQAERVAHDLRDASVGVIIDILPRPHPHQPGYAYFDGRQSQASAALVARFNDAARRAQIAPWSAQLQGVALPALGEYSADRVDIVLPELPASQTAP